jgi:selenocysteine lyase/cysteine desulfurase
VWNVCLGGSEFGGQYASTYFIDVHRTDMLTPATLGPLYTHTVVEVADDTSFGHIEQDESTLRNMINTNLNQLKQLSNRWLLKLNPTKTEIIIFNVNGVECNLTFNFDQTTIDPAH